MSASVQPFEAPNVAPALFICSRFDAALVLNAADSGPLIRSMISIGSPGEPPPKGRFMPAEVLRLEFHDSVVVDCFEGPSAEHVQQIIDFAPRIATAGGVCLIHCAAGISRSTATAIIVLATLLGPGGEKHAAQEVLKLVPHAGPNTLLLTLADRLLHRTGVLRSSVKQVFPTLPSWYL